MRTSTADTPRARRLLAVLFEPLNLIALLAGTIWLLVGILDRPIGDYGVETDFYGDFVRYARQWMRGEATIMNGYRGPFYYLVLGTVTLVLRDAFLTAKILSAVAGGVGVRLVGGLVRSLGGGTAGIAAALFLAASPHFVRYAFRACTDVVFFALFAGALALLMARDPSSRRWLAAGFVAGVAWLTRYNGVVLIPAAAIVAVFAVRPWGRAVGHLAFFLVGWAAPALPWMIYLWRETGDPLWSNSFQTVVGTVYASSPQAAQRGSLSLSVDFATWGEVVGVDPGRFFTVLGGNLFDHLRRDIRDLVGFGWVGAALLGVVLNLRGRPDRRTSAFVLIGLASYLLLLPVFYNPRFMITLLIWWGAAVGGIGAWLDRRGGGLRENRPTRAKRRRESPERGRWGAVAPVAGLVAVLLAVATGANVREVRSSTTLLTAQSPPMDIIDLARRARGTGARFDESTPVVAVKPHLGYHLGTPVMTLSPGSLEDLRRKGAHYLLVSGAEINAAPGLRPLWRARPGEDLPPELRFVAASRTFSRGERSAMAVLYAFNDPAAWTPVPPAEARRGREPIPGLSRLDHLRLQLGRWMYLWEPERPLERLFGHMSSEGREHPEVLLLRGDAALRGGDREGARTLYTRSLQARPGDRGARLRLAGLRRLAGDEAAFRQLLDGIVPAAGQRDSVRAHRWWELGRSLLLSGEYPAAAAPLHACLDLDSRHPAAREDLGQVYQRLGWGRARPAEPGTRE